MASSKTNLCLGCGAQLPVPIPGRPLRCEYCGLEVQPGYAAPPPAGAPFVPDGIPALGLPRPPGPPPVHPALRKRSPRKIILVLALILLGGGALGYFIWYMSWSRVDGSVRSEGGPLGTWSTQLTECNSGAAFVPQFFGVDLRAESPPARVQVQGGDSGKAVVVVGGPQGDEPHVDLTAQSCQVFDVFVDWTGSEVNDVDAVKGHLRVDCRLPDGGRIQANAEFDACH